MIVAITDRSLLTEETLFFERVLALIESPVRYVILREKDWEPDVLIAFLLQLMGRSDLTCRKIVIHSHVTVARHLGLTYVHLPEHRIDEVQKSHTQYSYSVHRLDQIEAINQKASLFNLISPVAPSTCKPQAQPVTSELLLQARALSKAPLIPLGGITPTVASQLKSMGFSHIAMRSELMTTADLESTLKPYIDLGFDQ